MSEKSGGNLSCPIFIVRSEGIDATDVLRTLTLDKQFFPCVDCANLVEGFQLLYRHRGGILAIEIKNRKNFLVFYRALSTLVRAVNALTVRILIFSNANEVLDSRALAQFQFIRCYQLPKQSSRLAEILLRESRNLAQAVTTHERRQTRAQASMTKSPLLMIRGSAPEKPVKKEHPVHAPLQQNPLSNCVGPEVPTYLYGAELSWRVRGFFSTYNPKTETIVFTANSESAQKKLLAQLAAGPVLLSSSSRPEGKICSALEFLTTTNKEFHFRVPSVTKVIQRRAQQRRRTSPQNQTLVRWYDTIRAIDRLFTVFDYGASGIGFLVPIEQKTLFKKEALIGPLFIYSQGREIEIDQVIIRHTSKSETDHDCLLVGVEFQKISARHRSLIEMMLFTGTL